MLQALTRPACFLSQIKLSNEAASLSSTIASSLPSRFVLISATMSDSVLSRHLAKLGRKGGKARLKTMTAEERKASARKAGKASAEARKREAKQRKARG